MTEFVVVVDAQSPEAAAEIQVHAVAVRVADQARLSAKAQDPGRHVLSRLELPDVRREIAEELEPVAEAVTHPQSEIDGSGPSLRAVPHLPAAHAEGEEEAFAR